jgi:hypothetical protein
MENEIIEMLTARLLASADFTAEMGEASVCQLYAGMAPEKAVMPYAVYRVDEGAQVTKDGAGEYDTVIVLVYPANKYRACLKMKNVVKGAIAVRDFTYVRADTAYVEEMDAYVSLVYFTSLNQ